MAYKRTFVEHQRERKGMIHDVALVEEHQAA